MLGGNLFGDQEKTIPADCDVVFVADMFAEDYIGGAELTTGAIVDSAPENVRVHKIHSKDVTMKTLESGYQKYWVFTNFSMLDLQLLPTIITNLRYSVLEYDYKFCKYRSPEKHEEMEKEPCNCANETQGNLISTFFHGAQSVFYMSEQQQARYFENFPFLQDLEQGSKQFVLSSVFDDKFFATIKDLREKYASHDRKGYLVLGSDSWIKGTDDAIEYCKQKGFDYEILQGLNPYSVLEKMAQAQGFVYLPKGGDTCPRMVIEAQLLGCELHVNDNVQHQSEYPFTDGTLEDVEIYLYGRRETFWQQTMLDMQWDPKISGYTTTYNCIDQKYPYMQSIKSMLGFCEEVVVMDGGSSDGTYEALQQLAETDSRVKVFQHEIDWKAPRSAIEDGLQKARARDKCSLDFCWQQDSDEIVHEKDYDKVFGICRQFPKFIDIVSLPVVEFWGGPEKVRLDINPWKWRLSRNRSFITHGIPKQLRKTDENGLLYAAVGTDGCDYVNNETYEHIPHATFYTGEIHNLRVKALQGDAQSLSQYQQWFDNVVDLMPCIYHYSWFDIERKIKTYQGFWQRHWESLYDIKQEDTIENNMFFEKRWADVNEDDIKNLAQRLTEEMGGWIFHSKVNFDTPVPHLTLKNGQPEIMNEFYTP